MDALEIVNVSKRFGHFQAVRNLSLAVPEGRVYGLLGPNGAGKTTTIRMVMNIFLPDSGKIRVLGTTMDEAMKSRIGYLPEDRGLYPKMKVGELLLFLAEIKGVRGAAARDTIDRWIRKFDLVDWKGKKVEELSKGMQQKVQFIVTMLNDPELIILDEPFGGLDPVNTKLLKDIMLGMKAEGRTIVFSTHRMEQVEMICDDICLISKGEKVLDGKLTAVKKAYGKNTIFLDYEGDGAFIEGLEGIASVDDYGKSMEIRLKEKTDPQNILEALSGRIRINTFEVREPSLNAIFIDKVGESHAENSVRR
ncbi:MAG: ATP-binding cassette domain-containing protein [Acidobacteria bacterium]|nr:ATP-binding cassette domain-containing protein [Acidobacteriota bacterium]MBU4253649.1 ATP-binding cassette domain-containing protein [Acidobacteriota bacterium]MBU4496336.1 ATP-binding cassette domain-containing protein [Acidobacteriota bacterium]